MKLARRCRRCEVAIGLLTPIGLSRLQLACRPQVRLQLPLALRLQLACRPQVRLQLPLALRLQLAYRQAASLRAAQSLAPPPPLPLVARMCTLCGRPCCGQRMRYVPCGCVRRGQCMRYAPCGRARCGQCMRSLAIADCTDTPSPPARSLPMQVSVLSSKRPPHVHCRLISQKSDEFGRPCRYLLPRCITACAH
jgi:hypothetical protein